MTTEYQKMINKLEKMADQDLPTDVCRAQGGGLVAYDKTQLAWVFIADPPTSFEVGDFMPEEWGIA